MMGRLDGQRAIVTGGASGLGRAVVQRFVAEGARVMVIDRSEAGLEEVAATHGDSVRTACADVRSRADLQVAVDAAIAAFGGIDCAIGNAGLWDYSKLFDDHSLDELDQGFDELLGVNLKGYLLLARAALPALVRARGSLIFTVSNAGFHPAGGGVLYTASKHAVVGAIRQLAHELGPAVRVNGVAPGPMDTHLRGADALGLGDRTIDQLRLPTRVGGNLILGRVPAIEEYTGAFVHLASREDSAPSTGGVVVADCGVGVRGFGGAGPGSALLDKYGQE